MLKYRLRQLARTSALPFTLCLAPVLVFAIAVRVIPTKGTATGLGSTRHTWFEKMYESGARRIGSVTGSSSANHSSAWERHEAEVRAAEARAAGQESTEQQSARRADELAQEQLTRDYGVDKPADLMAAELAHLTPEQERSLEKEMNQLLPRAAEYEKQHGRYVSYRSELARVVEAMPEMRQRGSRPRLIVEVPEVPERVVPGDPDPAHHNPFDQSRMPKPSVERITIVSQEKEQEYVNELDELWPPIMAGPPAGLNLAVPAVNVLLSNLYADRLTVADVETATRIVKEFPMAERFVHDQIPLMLRASRLISELGYHEQLDEQGMGSEQTFEDRPERSTYQLPAALTKSQQTRALEEQERRRIDEEIARERDEAMNGGSASADSNVPGSPKSLKSLLTDLVDHVRIGQSQEAVKILRDMVPDEKTVQSILGGALSVEQISSLSGYYYAKQRLLSDAEVMSILAPTSAQKIVRVTAVTSDELTKMCPAIDWTKVARDGPTFYRARCITEDLKSCRQYDLMAWTGGNWCCMGHFWEALN